MTRRNERKYRERRYNIINKLTDREVTLYSRSRSWKDIELYHDLYELYHDLYSIRQLIINNLNTYRLNSNLLLGFCLWTGCLDSHYLIQFQSNLHSSVNFTLTLSDCTFKNEYNNFCKYTFYPSWWTSFVFCVTNLFISFTVGESDRLKRHGVNEIYTLPLLSW